MTDFKNLILARQSCRKFDPREVDKETLLKLVEAFRLSPSACNAQPRKLMLVEEPAVLKPAIAARFHSQAFAQLDIGIATAHYCLMATDLGLSTCILGWMDEEWLKEALGIPKERRIRLVLATGYAAADDKLREKVRKPLSEMAEFRD